MNIEFELDLLSLAAKFIDFWLQNPVTIFFKLFFGGGWIVFLILIIYGLYLTWLDGRQTRFAKKWKHVLLAIDIPRNNEQSPKAVENIFVTLAGAQSSGNLIDRFWEGKVQESFSFEIVSLEGSIQFLVRTPGHFRDLIEAAVYAQYPEAEIVEVNDYAADYAQIKFPHDKYNLWGTEFLLVKDYPYPIRTYNDFMNPMMSIAKTTIAGSSSGIFIDPMAGLLEIMSRFGSGEQCWLQLVVTPQPPGWGDKAGETVKAIMGEKPAPKESALIHVATAPLRWLNELAIMATKIFAPDMIWETEKKEEKPKEAKLTPGLTNVLTNVQRKISKHAFRLKFRFIYLAEKTVFNKGKGVAAVIGAIQQFNAADANGFKPGKRRKTGADYFFVASRVAKRQNQILREYIRRSNSSGDNTGNMLLNVEELATLWHFPVISVKAPMVEKISSRKFVAPTRLPTEEPTLRLERISAASKPATEPVSAGQFVGESDDDSRRAPKPPINLPAI